MFSEIESKEQVEKLNDLEIIQLIIKTGKSDYFGVIYDRYANKVYRKCCSMLGNETDAQDITQTVLLKAFLNISTFEGRSSFSTWIYAITYNTCINYLKTRNKKKYLTDEFDDKTSLLLDNDDNLENKKLFEVELSQLMYLLEQIKPQDKMLLLMKYQDNMSIENIAKELDLSNSAVKMRLLRARARIRELRNKLFTKPT